MTRGTAALAILAVTLAGVVAAELQQPTAAPVATPGPGLTAAGPAANPEVEAVGGEDVAGLLARPPFSPSRRPDSGAVTPAAAVANLPLPRLTGILITRDLRQAMFAGPRAILAGEGDTIGRYRVQSIRPGEVLLDDGGTQHVLQPHYSAGGDDAARAPAILAPIGVAR